MKLKYDPEVDALYVTFTSRPVQVTTVRLSEDVAVDLGPGEEIAGIEILSASEHLNFHAKTPSVELENVQIG